MTGAELKVIVLDERKCVLCHRCFAMDGYCPQYDCNLTDKAKALTDRQWDNIAKEILNEDDLYYVYEEIVKRRIKHGNKKF